MKRNWASAWLILVEGTTDVAIFADGAIKYTLGTFLGGESPDQRYRRGVAHSNAEAEKIKKKYGCCLSALVGKEDKIEVPSVGGRRPRELSRNVLCEILGPRVEEIFALVNREIIKSGLEDSIASGVVITGGTSILEGMPELAEQIFNLPVREVCRSELAA